MVFMIFCCISSLTLLCPKFGIAKNYALFWTNFCPLKFGLCKLLQIASLANIYDFDGSHGMALCKSRLSLDILGVAGAVLQSVLLLKE